MSTGPDRNRQIHPYDRGEPLSGGDEDVVDKLARHKKIYEAGYKEALIIDMQRPDLLAPQDLPLFLAQVKEYYERTDGEVYELISPDMPEEERLRFQEAIVDACKEIPLGERKLESGKVFNPTQYQQAFNRRVYGDISIDNTGQLPGYNSPDMWPQALIPQYLDEVKDRYARTGEKIVLDDEMSQFELKRFGNMLEQAYSEVDKKKQLAEKHQVDPANDDELHYGT